MILIVGGFGFLGGRLKSELMKNYSDSLRVSTRDEDYYLNKKKSDRNTVYLDLQQDLTQLNCDFFEGIDVIISMASLNASDAIKYPSVARKIKINGTESLIQKAIK